MELGFRGSNLRNPAAIEQGFAELTDLICAGKDRDSPSGWTVSVSSGGLSLTVVGMCPELAITDHGAPGEVRVIWTWSDFEKERNHGIPSR